MTPIRGLCCGVTGTPQHNQVHDADPSKLEEWRRAPEGSQENISAAHYDEAMGVLAMSLR